MIWSLIKFIIGIMALLIVLSWLSTYFVNSSHCGDKGGTYTLTTHGFSCQQHSKDKKDHD